VSESWFDRYKVDVPEGTAGNYAIERYEVFEEDAKFSEVRAVISFSERGRAVPAGTYTRLVRKGGIYRRTVVMSDTPSEIRDHRLAIRVARGDVLLNGLGLGVMARACLMKPEVEHVTVVELAREVIMLVEPWLAEIARKANTRLTIIHANALEWQPPKNKRWDAVWHDIWDDICADNLPDMHKLHRRFGRRCDWQGSWCRAEAERNR